jgi:EmrB/QacA subfamily drug resistance transporter
VTAQHSQDQERLRLGTPTGRRVLAAAVLGTGATFFDGDAITVALPAISDDLGVGTAGLQWIVNLFLLVLASFLLIGGSLADRYGRRRMFLAGTVLFTVASIVAMAAPGMKLLLAARVLQGGGAALLVPVGLSIVSAGYVDEDRSAAIGWWSGLTATSSVIGPVVGGVLTSAWSWRGVLGAEVAILAVTGWLSAKHLVVPEAERSGHVDLAAAFAGAVAVGGLTFALIQGPVWGYLSPGVLAALAASGLSFPAFLVVESRRRDPMLPLELFRSRRFSVGNAVTTGVYFVFSGVLFVVVIMLQEALDYSPTAAGFAILPITGLLLGVSPVAGRLADRIGARWHLTAGPAVTAVGLLILASSNTADYVTGLLPGLAVFGLGMAATVAPLTSTVLAGLDERHQSLGSGVNTAIARTAGVLSIASVPTASGFAIDLGRQEMIRAFQDAAVLFGAVAAAVALIGLLTPGKDPET